MQRTIGSGRPGDPIMFESDGCETESDKNNGHISDKERCIMQKTLGQLQAARSTKETERLLDIQDAQKQRDTLRAYEEDLRKTEAREDAMDTDYKSGAVLGVGCAGGRTCQKRKTKERPDTYWTQTTFYDVTTLEHGAFNDGLRVQNETCSICRDAFRVGSSISKTPCGHLFHWRCIERERRTRARQDTHVPFRCPNCRSTIASRASRSHLPY
jgi:hypothetical protein